MEIPNRIHCLVICLLYSIRNGVVESSHIVYEELKDVTPLTIDNKYRTGFHFQPKRNWLNDPNGPMYYNGVYHLFYQYNPKGAVWGNIVWAHSVSRDMINWKALPSALYPSKPFDINGCWSGSATILPGNKPAILYTGVDPNNRQVQNIAFPKNLSDPYLCEWVKPDYNPIIDPDNWVNASAFRDPTTAWLGADGRYRIIIGSKRKHRGIAILYRSKDFIHWTRAQHPLHSANGTGMWECPDFYPVSTKETTGVDGSEYRDGLKYVLKNSLDLTRYEYYTIGSYHRDVDTYIPESTTLDDGRGLRYDYGNFYASKSFFDPVKKRRILWGWTNESDSRHDDSSKGWAGLQAIPRAVWLDSNKRQLILWPVEEIETLRGKHISTHNKVIRTGGLLEISGIMTAQSDVEATFQLSNLEEAEQFDPQWTDPQKLCEQKNANVKGGVGPFGLLSLATHKREEETAVFFRIFKDTNKYMALMCHDPSRSTLRPRLYKPTFGGWVDINIQKNGKISLRNLIDHSVVESFGAGGRTCITSRVYPSLATGQNAHLFVFNNGAEDIKITELHAWELMKPYMNGE